ncbi:MAG TPA: carboxypeptidase regulatory-like domain-containing protein [Longimicrobiales bacterium]
MRATDPRTIALLPTLFLMVTGSAVAGQSVLVQVLSAETQNPLAGAFVSVVAGNGDVVRSGLTDESGTALFLVAISGSVRVQAEMIGRVTQVSAPLDLRGDRTGRVRLLLPQHTVALEEIRVEAEDQCRVRPDQSAGIARVWESVRTSLRVQAWTEREARFRLRISTYERDLDPSGRRVERESRRTRRLVTRTPFRSVPPSELAAGFVRPLEDGGHEWLGADAALLLSDEFLNTHCFGLTRSPAYPAAIGLTFAPAHAARADIAGTLWLDEETGRLDVLEYRYTSLPQEEARGIAGGRAEFEAMPDGSWIIRNWWIRAPVLARDPRMARAGDSGIRVIGIRETGGEVLGITSLARETIREVQRAVVSGIVWDSTRAAPLARATVFLTGTAHAATTDAAGHFTMPGLAPGVFTAVFTHPRLDELGIAASEVEVEVSAGDTVELRLAIPSLAAILVAACRAEGDTAGAVVSGVVTDRSRGQPIPGATVRVQWQEVERMQPAVQARDHWFEVRTDTAGRYTACGIPVDEAVTIRAALLTRSSAPARVAFARPEHRAVDLTIDLPVTVDGSGAEVAPERSGFQGVQGILTDRASGAPVSAVAITIRDAAGEAMGDAMTDQRGFFRIEAPVPGRFLLSASALGYRPLEGEALEIARGRLAVLEISLASEAVQLDPLVVMAESRAFHLEVEGFYRRQLESGGFFVTPELMAQRRPRLVSDLLFGVAGAHIAEPTTGIRGRAVWFTKENCWPMVYVDRFLVSAGGLLEAGGEPAVVDELVPAADIQAVEVYRSPAEVPSEFNGPNAGCGVVVIWTRRGGSD